MSQSPWRPGATMDMLQTRARILAGIRAFFSARHCLEVETPIVAAATVTDPNIDSFGLPVGETQRFLQTSPEYHMKRLLAAGSGAIFQVARVFRYGEQGRWHNPEFTLLEWYRPGYDYFELMDEISELLQTLFALAEAPGQLVARGQRRRWQDLFREHLQLDPLTATWQQLLAALPAELGRVEGLVEDERDPLLDLLFSTVIQPALAAEGLVFVHDYPASQASLARLRRDDPRFAERFEVFINGVELGNGFTELTDAAEQRQRFGHDRELRLARGAFAPAPDERLLSALAEGMPDCAGVALGLDRLLMALTGAGHIREVLSFDWSGA